jgi:bifunctional DNA-binding transcriptional regulator/antitoxin component of YhaV-PrlF toxin-antitoxin module
MILSLYWDLSKEPFMKKVIASISSRGQVTIPVAVQRELGLKPRGKVVFEIDGGAVRLTPPRFTLETLRGSVTPINRPEDFEELSRLAKEEKARETFREMGIIPE